MAYVLRKELRGINVDSNWKSKGFSSVQRKILEVLSSPTKWLQSEEEMKKYIYKKYGSGYYILQNGGHVIFKGEVLGECL